MKWDQGARLTMTSNQFKWTAQLAGISIHSWNQFIIRSRIWSDAFLSESNDDFLFLNSEGESSIAQTSMNDILSKRNKVELMHRRSFRIKIVTRKTEIWLSTWVLAPNHCVSIDFSVLDLHTCVTVIKIKSGKMSLVEFCLYIYASHRITEAFFEILRIRITYKLRLWI